MRLGGRVGALQAAGALAGDGLAKRNPVHREHDIAGAKTRGRRARADLDVLDDRHAVMPRRPDVEGRPPGRAFEPGGQARVRVVQFRQRAAKHVLVPPAWFFAAAAPGR